MKAIIGLGNPDKEHERTRHNAGFRVVEELAGRLGAQWESSEKFFAEIARAGDVLLVKPQTYMNASGRAVQAVTQFYKIAPEDVVVVHDDLDIPLGGVKFARGSGPKAHNGLLSIYEMLGTQDFWHLRLGVDGRGGNSTMPGSAYVLAPFDEQEEPVVDRAVVQAVETLLPFIK